MRGKLFASLALMILLAPSATAQPAARFQWRPGQTLVYRVAETITKKETVDSKRSDATTKLQHLKQWKVLDVDEMGVATLEMSLRTFRLEQPTPTGEVLVFDSDHPDQSNPQLREQLSKFVGAPLATLRIDRHGRVREVRECRFGPASRFETQLPFVLALPDEGPSVGQTWERTYQMTLDPPAGLGEKFDAVQRYACQSVEMGVVRIALRTALKSQPQNPAEQAALLLNQPQGEIQFDLRSGRMKQVLLQIDAEVKNHAGEGSSLRLVRTYQEEFAGEQ